MSGAPAINMRDRVVFQDIDQVGMARPVCKWSAEAATVAQVPFLLSRAYCESSSGRMGATHLTAPADLFTGQAAKGLPLVKPQATVATPDRADVKAMLKLLREAKRPVVIAGSGVWWSDAGKELGAFLRKTKLPYYSVTLARGVVSDAAPNNMGYADGALNKAVSRKPTLCWCWASASTTVWRWAARGCFRLRQSLFKWTFISRSWDTIGHLRWGSAPM